MKPPNETDNMFCSIAWLYSGQLATPGQLATAIEMHGIDGWDDFYRYRHCEPDSPEAKSALAALSAGLKHNRRLEPHYNQLPWPDNVIDIDDLPENRYGWSKADLPAFCEDIEPSINQASATKLSNSEAKLLAAFLKSAKFDIDGINRVAEARKHLELIGISMDDKTIRATLLRARKHLPK